MVSFTLSLLMAAATQLAQVASFPMPPQLNLFMKSPLEDDFYKPPSNLSDYKNGEIYRERKIDPDVQLKVTLADAYQVAYKSTDVDGKDTYTLATVFKPLNPTKEAKLFSYQFWEDSTNLNCSPSYTLVKGLLSPDWITGVLDTAITLQFALLNGWYVVVPDHEGPRSAWLEGYASGRQGLDGIRAALNHFHLDPKTPTALFGYSGGGSATAWMGNLHESYAPEINIVGAAHGGPIVDEEAFVKWTDGTDNLFSGFGVAGIGGLLNGFREHNKTIWPHLHDSLKKRINTMLEGDKCVPYHLLHYTHTDNVGDMDVDFSTFPAWAEIHAKESLLKNHSSGILTTPKFPRYFYHAEQDEVVPFAPVKQYVEEQCADGANIQFVPWKGNDHVSVEFLGLPDAYQFLKQALNGNLPQVKCGEAPKDVLTLASTTVGAAIGQGIADLIAAVNGFTMPWGQKVHIDTQQGYES